MIDNPIIIIEGVDCCGKSDIAKAIATEFNVSYIDTDIGNALEFKRTTEFFDGINLATIQFFKSIHQGMVKPRFALSQYAYQKIYKREPSLNQHQLEAAIGPRLVSILIDIDYEKYIELSREYRKNERILSPIEFKVHRTTFLEASVMSHAPNNFIVKNNASFSELYRNVRKVLMDTIC